MQISSSASSLATTFAALRSPSAKPAAGRLPFDIAQARADSADDKRRLEENAARHAGAIASFASQGLTLTQGSYTMRYKQELAQSIDGDGDGRLGLEEFGESVRDPFRDAGFRSQLEGRGSMDPAAIGALHRRHAAQYDAASVLGAMARAIDSAA